MDKPLSIAVIAASGIGNTIMFTPALREFRKHHNDATITIIVTRRVYAECIEGASIVDRIIVVKGIKDVLKNIIFNRQRYDVSLTAFPSNKWQFNLFAFLVGAKKRITHSYSCGRLRTLSFLQNDKVQADPFLHDVYQNIRLLKSLNIDTTGIEPALLFYLSTEDEHFADDFLRANSIKQTDYLIGVHAGAGPIGDRKKWGINNFAKEINGMASCNDSSVVFLFGGPEEKEEREALTNLLKTKRVIIFGGTLKQTASLIKRCNFFLSNDTGLMHVAACFGITQKAIFISTNPTRTSPFNNNATVQIEGDCSLYKYPFWSTK